MPPNQHVLEVIFLVLDVLDDLDDSFVLVYNLVVEGGASVFVEGQNP